MRSDGITVSGSIDDFDLVRRLAKKFGPRLMWFRCRGEEYVITDTAKLEALRASEDPHEAELRSTLEREEHELEAREAQLDTAEATLDAERESLDDDDDDDESAGEAHARASRSAAIEQAASHLAHERRDLERRAAAIEQSLERLEDARERRFDQLVQQLIETALDDGTAQPVK